MKQNKWYPNLDAAHCFWIVKMLKKIRLFIKGYFNPGYNIFCYILHKYTLERLKFPCKTQLLLNPQVLWKLRKRTGVSRTEVRIFNRRMCHSFVGRLVIPCYTNQTTKSLVFHTTQGSPVSRRTHLERC